MGDRRWDRLAVAGAKPSGDGWDGVHVEADASFDDPQGPPGPLSYVVAPAQRSGKAGLGEGSGRSSQVEVVRQLCPVAEGAVEVGADPGRSALGGQHPWPVLKWGVVPDVLAVQAGQVDDPVALRVLIKAGDAALHGSQFDRAAPAPGRAVDEAFSGR